MGLLNQRNNNSSLRASLSAVPLLLIINVVDWHCVSCNNLPCMLDFLL